VLGLDLGSVRIGVAVTDSSQAVAVPLEVMARSGDRAADLAALASIVADHEAVGVVVGVPLSLSGAEGPAARSVLVEVEELRCSLGVEVETFDERLSSLEVYRRSARQRSRRRAARPALDAEAAAVVLQAWADRRRRR
jgi:putative Holliday junction resolvase